MEPTEGFNGVMIVDYNQVALLVLLSALKYRQHDYEAVHRPNLLLVTGSQKCFKPHLRKRKEIALVSVCLRTF